ncbi:MAG: 5-oxoprolinase, partial [Deltaproteobacteria bacterium]
MTALWTDQGGTFTDIVRLRADGTVEVDKVLSDRAARATEAGDASEVRRGTTVATNALLERTGVPVLLLTTRGFADAPWIGDQVRPALFGLRQERPAPLCAEVIEVDGRIAAPMGGVPPTVVAPHEVDIDALTAARARGIDAVAIVLVHGPLVPAEEARLADLCRALGFRQVSVGHEVAPSRGFIARLHTTLADAALSPLLPRQPGGYMKSDGGIAPVDADGRGPEWRGCHAVLSGPAGGVVATAHLAEQVGAGPVFGFDMGGTSTDVCRVDGDPDRVDRIEVAGVHLRVPAVRIETVAAGGGSILSRRGGAYVCGPASAGADPGPACYGRGGPPTVTDCAAVLGLLADLPPVAGPTRDQPLDIAAARSAIAGLDPGRPVEQVAEGFLRVAVEQMARAVRRLAANRGVDPAGHTLVAFGGAGPGHACGVARALGIRTILVPHFAGVFSAIGIGLATPRATRSMPVRTTLRAAVRDLRAALDASRVPTDGGHPLDEFQAVLRYRGTQEGIPVPLPTIGIDPALDGCTAARPAATLVTAFHAAHAELFGFSRPELPVELVELRGTRRLAAPSRSFPVAPLRPRPPGTTRAFLDGAWREVPLRDAHDADGLLGPAILRVHGATVVVAPGFRVQVAEHCLRLVDEQPVHAGLSTDRHPVHTAVFGTRLMAVAEQMGERLARLARSVNIRERRDFSCAVFDGDGHLVANAPHVPVHLGAMGETVRALLATRGAQVTADTAWATNDPYAGGSHLPDITVVMPVVHRDRRVALVACRGHHVDVGGITPGSMPPHATDIAEEGVLIRHEAVLRDGRFRRPAALDRDPADGGSRQPDDLAADLAAQVAACRFGVDALRALVDELGSAAFTAQLRHIQDLADDAVGELLPTLPAHSHARAVLDAGPHPPHPL